MTDISVDPEMERIIALLKRVIKESSFNQVSIQKALGWKGSYISQLLNRTKALRVQQLLMILAVIDYSPSDFFHEIFDGAEKRSRPRSLTHDELVEEMKDQLQAFTSSLVDLLRGDTQLSPDQEKNFQDGVASTINSKPF